MCGSGGGSSPAPQDNSLQLAQMNRQFAEEDRARADADAAQKKTDFQNNLSQAIAGARTTGMNYLGQRGLSGDQYGSTIDQIIADTKNRVPELDPNPGSYFTSDTFASGLDNLQTLKRGNASGKVSSTFAPGYETNYIPDSADDAIINEILAGQRGQAQTQVDFQRKRGLLNDSGYNTAEQKLGDQENAARSTLSSIGTGVLNKDRGDLTNIVANAGNAASNWSLGMPDFDVNPYSTRVQNTAQEKLGNLKGDIGAALGSTQLFDIPSIIAAGGIAQGPQNLTTADAAPGMPFNKKNVNTNRGLGSTGTF